MADKMLYIATSDLGTEVFDDRDSAERSYPNPDETVIRTEAILPWPTAEIIPMP